MNRLKKPRPTASPSNASSTNVVSRTMQLAVGGMRMSAPGDNASSVSSHLQQRGAALAAAPHTKAERYWAARALVAETLLSTRDRHQADLAEVRRMEGEKREREIQAMLHANDQRQRRSELLMVMYLVVLLGFMAWLVMMIAPERGTKNKPSHFTIPILSPFASVVEHETGVFGTKAVVVLVVVVGVAAYAMLRYCRWHA